MKAVAFAFFAAISAAAAAVAGERVAEWVDVPEASFLYQDGVRWATKTGPVSIAVALYPRDKSTGYMQVMVLNSSDAAVNVLNRDVVVSSGGAPLRVWTAQDVAKQVKRSQFWERLGTGLAAAGNSYNASQAGAYSQQGNFSGSYASQGVGSSSGKFAGSYTAQGFDSTAQQQAMARANAQNAQAVSDLNAKQQAEASGATAGMLLDQTVPPGTHYLGYLVFDLPKRKRGVTHPILVRISVADVVLEAPAQVGP